MQHINISVSNDEKNFYGKDEYGNNNCNKEDYFNDIWNNLKKIEEKYLDKIFNHSDYFITDDESELFYEQGIYLENIEWTDDDINDIPPIKIYYVTYRKLNKEQLKYYIYWRTCFKKGKYIVTGYKSYYYLYAYELMAELGDFSIQERWEQFRTLYEQFEKEGLSYSYWLLDYCHLYGLPIKKEIPVEESYNNNLTIVKEIISSNYDNVFEFIQRKSAWKVKGSTFVKRADCLEDIKIIIKNMMPELEKLFLEKGLVFSDFLIGKYGMVEYDAWPYRRSVWTAKVLGQIIGKPPIKKIFDEILPDQTIYITDRYGEIKRATATKLYYYDPYLSEYILKYTEMMFREYFGYEYLAWPEALIGALKMRIGGCVEYILSTNKEYQKKQKKYISLYPNITKIIRFSVKDYMDKNEKRLNALKKVFEDSRPKISNKGIVVSKSPGIEEIVSFINTSSMKLDMKELLKFYETMTMTTKKTKAKILTQIIWNFWILHGCAEYSYEELKEKIIGNDWDIEYKKFIADKNYRRGLSYLTSRHDPRKGVLKSYYSEEIIVDCILLALKAFNKVCDFYNVDSTEILLGEWTTKKIEKKNEGIDVYTDVEHEITINLDDIEIYQYSPSLGLILHTYNTNGAILDFVQNFMKLIDMELRKHVNYRSALKIDTDYGMFSISKYRQCIEAIPKIISKVVRFVLEYNNPKKTKAYEKHFVEINKNNSRKLEILEIETGQYLSVTECIDEAIKDYYPISEITKLKIDSLDKYSKAIDNNDWITAINALERAVNLGYKKDYSIIYQSYLFGKGNLEADYKKGTEWLSRFYKDYHDGEIDSDISAKTMLEVCYNLGISHAKELERKNISNGIEYTEQLFYEAINYGIQIEKSDKNTIDYLLEIGCCFYYGEIKFFGYRKISVEKNFSKAYKAFSVAEKLGNTTAMFMIAKMYENGAYVFKNKEYAKRLYLEAAMSKETNAVIWCQNNFIDFMQWDKLDIWDKVSLPSDSLEYVKETELYKIKRYSEFKQLKIRDIIEHYSEMDIPDLCNYFSTTKKYMDDLVLYLDIRSNPKIKDLYLLRNNYIDDYHYEEETIYNNFIKSSFLPNAFINYINSMSEAQRIIIDKVNSKEYDVKTKKNFIINLLLKRTVCLAYEISIIYNLDIQDVISEAWCGLVEAVNKHSLRKNKNLVSDIMKYVLEYISVNNYKNQISRLTEIKCLVYDFAEIDEVDGTVIFNSRDFYNINESEPDSIIYEENWDMICNIADLKKFLNILTKKEQKIICLYYGIECDRRKIGEIANVYGISGQRVSQIIKRVLEKIKKYLRQ